jgi:hypothetical protein
MSPRYAKNNLSTNKLALVVDVSSAAVNDGIKGDAISMTHCLSFLAVRYEFFSYQTPHDRSRSVNLTCVSDELQ